MSKYRDESPNESLSVEPLYQQVFFNECQRSSSSSLGFINFLITFCPRKSDMKNDTDVAQEQDEEEISLSNFILSWIVEERQGEGTNSTEIQDHVTEEPEAENVTSVSESPSVVEEDHLELFYIASTLLLFYMIALILKRHWNYSKKRSIFFANIKKNELQQPLNSLSATSPGLLRLNSFH